METERPDFDLDPDDWDAFWSIKARSAERLLISSDRTERRPGAVISRRVCSAGKSASEEWKGQYRIRRGRRRTEGWRHAER